MISCPDCAGVVQIERGPGDHEIFVCTVGHTFSLHDLYQAQEERLEQAQWSVIVLMKHLQTLIQLMLDTERGAESYVDSELSRRVDQIIRQSERMKEMIEQTQLPMRKESFDEVSRSSESLS